MTSCLDIYRLNTIEHNCPKGGEREDGWFQYSGERCPQEALLPIVSEEQLPGHQSESGAPSWRVHIAGFHDSCSKIKHIWNKLSTPHLTSVEHLFCSVDAWPGKGLPYWTLPLADLEISFPSFTIWGHFHCPWGLSPSEGWCSFQWHRLWMPVTGVSDPNSPISSHICQMGTMSVPVL